MYVMPEGAVEGEDCVRAFFEETSLVGRDERRLEFNTLKERAMKRLKHLGMTIKDGSIQEEEYCYIPMGGNLPDLTQRVVAVGGAAATVHPSTGYQLCRMLAQSTDVCTALSSELKRGEAFNPEAASALSARFRLLRSRVKAAAVSSNSSETGAASASTWPDTTAGLPALFLFFFLLGGGV